MAEISLLHPYDTEPEYKELPSETQNDLSIDFLCDALSKETYEKNILKKVMVNVTDDEKVIKYRGDIFEDLLNFPDLRVKVGEMLEQLEYLRNIEKFAKDSDASSLWQLANRLQSIDVYINCITNMKTSLETEKIRSEGLLKLKKYVTDIYNDSGFPQLKQDIAETTKQLRQVKSITIGVNLDNQLKPKTAGIVSLNDSAYTKSGILKNFISFAGSKEEIHHGTDDINQMKFHPGDTTGDNGSASFGNFQNDAVGMSHFNIVDSAAGSDALSDAMKKSVTNVLKSIVRELKSTLSKYVNISGYSLVSLIPEFKFYLCWTELIEKIKVSGCTLCKATIANKDQREMSATGLYNIKLAIKKINDSGMNIVPNDFDFTSDHRIYIMTGPNRGGKTTFTQAVGLVFLLAQAGIYVPCESCTLSPADCIFTHFPADENDTMDLGRLGEESKRFSEIFDAATNKSLILMNESFATTTFNEGLYIATGVVKALKLLGARTIFNTHMHDLAHDLDKLDEEIKSDSKIASLVTGMDMEHRSYKVTVAPPQGKSYAKDIAQKYGVTFEQLKTKFS